VTHDNSDLPRTQPDDAGEGLVREKRALHQEILRMTAFAPELAREIGTFVDLLGVKPTTLTSRLRALKIRSAG